MTGPVIVERGGLALMGLTHPSVSGVAQLPNRVVEDAEQRHPCAEPEGVRRHPPEPEMPASLHRDLHRVDHNALAADNWSSADFVENGVGRQGSQPTLAKRSQME